MPRISIVAAKTNEIKRNRKSMKKTIIKMRKFHCAKIRADSEKPALILYQPVNQSVRSPPATGKAPCIVLSLETAKKISPIT